MVTIKKVLIYWLCIACMGITTPAFGFDGCSYEEALNVLGLFRGTEKGFELERKPTRSEILVMIIRLLGKEEEALECSYSHPFNDTQWDEPYVSYGYNNAIIQGISDDSFGGSHEASLRQYCAMLLRVLGYEEANDDFTYDNAVSFATLAFGEVIVESDKFNRKKMAQLTCYALSTRKKDSYKTLGQTLVEEGVILHQQLSDAQRYWEQAEEHLSTTVLIYTVGSDLESQQGRLTNDLKEILRAEPKENCRVLIQTGGTIQYHNEWMTNKKAERFLVEGSNLYKIESNIETSASEPQTLTEFILWGVKQAPSQRYILVLWDHGYGIKEGFGADELNEKKTMQVSEIKTAIENSDVYFEIIIFDACLMGSVETVYALRNYTKYLIASEESMPACGLYYTTWLGALERNPSMSTKRLGRLILDSFILHAGIEANIPSTISMFNVSRVETLIDYMPLFTGDLPQKGREAELLGKNDGVFDQFDLLSVMQGVPQITAATQAMASEVRNSSHGGQYCGVALYIPVYKPEEFSSVMDELKIIGLNETYLNIIYKDYISKQGGIL